MGAPDAALSADAGAPRSLVWVPIVHILDRILNKGVVLAGEVVISVADIDSIYLNVRALLTSVETAYRHRPALVVASVEKAREMGMDWWTTNPEFRGDPAARTELTELRQRLEQLEARAASPVVS